MKFKSLHVLVLLLFGSCQDKKEISDLRENSAYDSSKYSPGDLSIYEESGKLNYSKTLIYTYNPAGNPYYRKTLTGKPPDSEISLFSQAFTFVGDYENASKYSRKLEGGAPMISDSSYLKKIIFKDAKEYILNTFRKNPVLMFNEAHDRVQTRTFLLSVLGELRKAGAEFLAMETLYPKGNLKSLDNTTGYYTAEPISGQIVREALQLGYKLIAYEDTIRTSSSSQRDSIQAMNILKRITNDRGVAKTIVLAGYGHISECGDNSYQPMAASFKNYSGVDPITINQTDLIEFPVNPTLRPALELIYDKPVTREMALSADAINSLYLSMEVGEPPKCPYYDVYIFFPNSEYIHKRPAWLLTSKNKKLVGLEMPHEIKPVLIQAYISSEITGEPDFDTRVPYDQTFTLDQGKAWLVLDSGKEYEIVYRSQDNKIIYKTKWTKAKL
jgi:hypothetical protein